MKLISTLFNFLWFQNFNESELLDCLRSGKLCKQYSERVRAFALTLHFYSPRAYSYLRETFNNALPAISTIRSWYGSIDGSPGFSTDAFEALKQKAADANKNGKEVLTCLIFDEMFIRKHVQWDHASKKFYGFIDYGANIDVETCADVTKPIAKEVLMFLVSGINESFAMPVAYFLINGLKRSEKSAMIQEVVVMLSKTGIKIIGMTFDGLKANISVCTELGAHFESNGPFITNPHTNDNIYIFLDPAHMEKLSRNCLAKKKILYDENDDKIEWVCFEKLERIQRVEGFNFGNQLNKTHIQWEKKVMNVRIAVETLSDSVADSMEILQKSGHSGFKNCEATIKYIRRMNNLFDIMNSMRPDARNFKRPLSKETNEYFFAYFNESIQYLSNLKLERNGKSILKTNSKTAFFGFIQNMNNFRNIYNNYVPSGIIDRIFTYRFSQDHLEMIFGRIRARLGSNDNPTVEQFKSAYRRLFVRNEICSSKSSNCIDTGINILTVSSRRPKLKEDYSNDAQDENEPYLRARTENNQLQLHEISEHTISYTAYEIEKAILEAKDPKKSIKCYKCVKTLYENEQIQNIFLDLKSNAKSIFQPCKSTFEICALTEEIIKSFDDINAISYTEVVKDVIYRIDMDAMFPLSDFNDHPHANHKSFLVQYLAESYLSKRLKFISKCSTLAQHDEFNRHCMKKAIHRSGQ